MKKRYKFRNGTDGDEDKIPPKRNKTLEEYIAERAAQEQDKYFWKGSRNRNEAYKLTEPIGDEEKEYALRAIDFYLELMNNSVNDYAVNHNVSPVLAAIELSRTPNGDDIEDDDVRRYVTLREDMFNLQAMANGENLLPSCIATATSNHPYGGHFVSGNRTFAANPDKYGWKRVELKDIKRGSLVQHLDSYNVPSHAVILDGISPTNQRFVNYAPSVYPNYKKHKADWRTENEERYYNFVGNSADSLRWTNEYNNLNLKRLGGISGLTYR